jgi:tRNA (guanosine-2'-O-)-methyltransferase
VIEVLEPLVLERRRDRIWSVVTQRLESVTVLMDAPHDPHNGAAVMRSCDAFGVREMHVVIRGEPFLASRHVAQGTERWIDVVVHDSAESATAELRRRGYQLVATHPRGELVPDDLGELARVALVLGNERDGIRDSLEQAATHSVRIPMRGFVESLNVSVSAAILLHAATRNRAGDLPVSEQRLLYAKGLLGSVPRAHDVLSARACR